MIFAIYFIMNGFARFFIEKIRVNIRYEFFGMEVTQAEVIAVSFVVIGIAGIIYFRQRHRKSSA